MIRNKKYKIIYQNVVQGEIILPGCFSEEKAKEYAVNVGYHQLSTLIFIGNTDEPSIVN